MYLPGGVFLLLVMLFGCSSTPSPLPLAFYHWKSSFAPGACERAKLDSLGVNELYVRYFDLAVEPGTGAPYPMAPLGSVDTVWGKSWTPVVYITQPALLRLERDSTAALAGRILHKIRAMHTRLNAPPLREIQMDCDWTPRTREGYFSLLRDLRKQLGRDTLLSVTLRLNQIRHKRDNGIPPVDKAVLMCYNMGNLNDPAETNSIFRQDLLSGYLKELDAYEFPLDIALPLFSWGVVIRNGHPLKLIHNLQRAECLAQDSLRPLADGRFMAAHHLRLHGAYIYPGDLIRLEGVTTADLRGAAALIRERLNHRPGKLILYHVDGPTLCPFPADSLRRVQALLE